MKITLKDGSVKEYASAMSVIDIAKDISEGLARAACAGEVDGKVVDLRTVISEDCNLNILTAADPAGLKVLRHTAGHVLAEAVKRLFPDAKCTIGPAIEDGFYYDFDSQPFSREDLDKLEAEMKKIVKEGHELKRFTLPKEEAIKFMEERNEPYKVELIQELPEGAEISSYDANRRAVEVQNPTLGYKCNLLTETEVITYILDYLHRRQKLSWEEVSSVIAAPFWQTIHQMPPHLQEKATFLRRKFSEMLITGPFSILVGFQGGLMALNDRLKLRSLVAAERKDMVYFASEECAIAVLEPSPEKIWSPRGGEPVIVTLNPKYHE